MTQLLITILLVINTVFGHVQPAQPDGCVTEGRHDFPAFDYQIDVSNCTTH